MKKITFKNLPDKTAPISANNLNQLQNNVEEAILNPVVESIKSKNLVNEIITGYTLNGSGGVSATSTQFVTGFMEVEGGKTYTSQGFKGANGVENNYKDWYTADKTFISNTNDKTATAPSNAIFCRMNGTISTSSNMQLEEGNTATEFTHYKSFGYTSGSNENGYWVKYDDGRMECWQRFGETLSIKNTFSIFSGTGYYAQLNARAFPQPFTQLDGLVMDIEQSSNNYALHLMTTGISATLTHTCSKLVISPSLDENDYIIFSYHAIGRWK